MQYSHTQIGHLMIYILVAVAALYWWIFTMEWMDPEIVVIMILVLCIIGSFTTLTVSIDGQFLRIQFWYGIYRKKFLLSDIAEAKAVKNRWYYGRGIKFRWRPPTWIYNVSGFDAVQITMTNDKRYKIGTDEPDLLEAALRTVLSSQTPPWKPHL